MTSQILKFALSSFSAAAISLIGLMPAHSDSVEGIWEEVKCQNAFHARHESGMTAVNDKIYLFGGRGIKPVDELDTGALRWQTLSKPPFEMHHFQPIVLNEKIYIIGAMTGKYPHETPVSHIWIFDPKINKWQKGAEIPENRRRGGSGVSVYKGNIYISGGIQNGHWDGTVAWFDEYNPSTQTWRVLPNMPNARDHFQSAIIDGKYYAAGGRITSTKTGNVFDLVVNEVDIYDFETNTWTSSQKPLPTGRAGNTTIAHNGQLWVIGGESGKQGEAHNELEIYSPKTESWSAGPPLIRGRHGTGAVLVDGHIWTATGSGRRGGQPELLSIERIKTDL